MNRHHYRTPSLSLDDDTPDPILQVYARRAAHATAVYARAHLENLRLTALRVRTLAALFAERPAPTSKHVGRWFARRLYTIPALIIAIWYLVLLRGEHFVFENALAQCRWQDWESWVRYDMDSQATHPS